MDKDVQADKLYTTRQAADIFKVTEQTGQRYLRNGDLRGRKLGLKKRWHVPGGDLLRIMKKRGYT